MRGRAANSLNDPGQVPTYRPLLSPVIYTRRLSDFTTGKERHVHDMDHKADSDVTAAAAEGRV